MSVIESSYSAEVKGIKNFDEALETFGINFDVAKTKLGTNSGGFKTIPMAEAMIRTDTKECLGVVSPKYPVISPKEKFGVFSSFADENIIEFVDGGRFGKFGGKVYLQARIDGSLNINAEVGDIIEKRITFISSYDGTKANELIITPYRLICENGLAIPEKALSSFRYKNSKNIATKIEKAVLLIENAISEYRNIDVLFKALTESKEVNDTQIEKFAEIIIPSVSEEVSTRTANRRTELINTIHSGLGQNEINETNLWKLFNGVTCFVNNIEGAKKKENPFDFIYFGTGNNLNERAYNLVGELVESGNYNALN